MKEYESQEQQALIYWTNTMRYQMPELQLLYAVPNGGVRHKSTAERLKKEGVKAGVPDLCLPVARCGKHGLYIEMKYGKNKQSEKQKQWQKELEAQGYEYALCYGWMAARDTIINYLKSNSKGDTEYAK